MSTHVHPHAHGAPRGAPLLDIGGNVGAVVVYLPGPTPSGELEARPAGDPTRRFHTGVHPRDVGGATTQVAVYPEIVEGTYEILDEHLEPVARVDVRGGEVTELHLH